MTQESQAIDHDEMERMQRAANIRFDMNYMAVAELIGMRKAVAQQYLGNKPSSASIGELKQMINWYDDQIKKLLAL